MSNLKLLKKVDIGVRQAEEKGMTKTEVRAKVDKYEVDWNAAKHLGIGGFKNHYLGRIFGYSEEFMKQMRAEIAAELAETEISQNPALNRNETIAKYIDQLKDTGASDLLKVRKQSYVGKERKAFADVNRDSVKPAILALNAKYLNKLNKTFPAGDGDEQKAFIKNFVMNSRAFNEKGGRDRILSHEEMEDALINYIVGEADQKYRLNYEQSDTIQHWQLKEMKTVAELVDFYDKSLDMHIDPEKTLKIINLWQEKVGHKKSLLEEKNKEEVDDFLKDAYTDGQIAATEAHSKNPRKAGESVSDYGDRLINAIEKNLKDNEAAKLAYGNEYYAILFTETSSRDKECLIKVKVMLDGIKRKENETREEYIKRASEEIRSKLDPSDMAMRDAAHSVLERFASDQRVLQASETIFKAIRAHKIYKSFDDREKRMFNNMFSNRVGKISSNDQQDLNKVRVVAQSVLEEVKERKEAAAKEFSKRETQMHQILNQFLSAFERDLSENENAYYDSAVYGEDELTLKEMLANKYDSFINSDSNLKSFLNRSVDRIDPSNDEVISDFKKYLNKDEEFRSVLNRIETIGIADSQNFLTKLRDSFGITVQENPIKAWFKSLFIVEIPSSNK